MAWINSLDFDEILMLDYLNVVGRKNLKKPIYDK